jgi:hypothetical protein
VHNLGTWRKYGYLGPEEIGTAALSETMVIPTVDGGHLVLSMLSTGERGASYPLALKQAFGDLMTFDHMLTVDDMPLPDFSTIPTAGAQNERFNYGFIIPHKVILYRLPDTNAETIANSWRRDFAFPVATLPSGTLIRFFIINDNWGQIVWNDNLPSASDHDVFIRLDDLYIVDDAAFAPIHTIHNTPEVVEKYVVLHKPTSTLTLMENTTPIFKTPVLMNERRTSDGMRFVVTNAISGSRYDFPFVNLVTVYGEAGQAIYSAPWEWWDETVYEGYEILRYSDGDIRIPDWVVDIPGYGEIRADFFIFRWLGGMTNPAENIVEKQSPAVIRIYSIHSDYNEFYSMTKPTELLRQGVTWQQIIELVDAAPLNAPNFFFAEDRSR